MAGATIRRFAAKFKKKRYRVERKAGFGLRTRLGVGEVPIDQEAELALAARTGLTAEDASHLWFANELGAALVTLDRQLDKACRAARPA